MVGGERPVGLLGDFSMGGFFSSFSPGIFKGISRGLFSRQGGTRKRNIPPNASPSMVSRDHPRLSSEVMRKLMIP